MIKDPDRLTSDQNTFREVISGPRFPSVKNDIIFLSDFKVNLFTTSEGNFHLTYCIVIDVADDHFADSQELSNLKDDVDTLRYKANEVGLGLSLAWQSQTGIELSCITVPLSNSVWRSQRSDIDDKLQTARSTFTFFES